jgi:hypothetical protein
VFPEYVAAFRPVELITLRSATGSRLRYCGCATYYDPPAVIRERMRELAREVGAALRERVGFRGVFTVDGVVTDLGFLPTELNPRWGAGMSTFNVPDLPLAMLAQACAEGEDLDYRQRELEDLVLGHAEARRGGGAWTMVRRGPVGSQAERSLVWEDGGYRFGQEGEPADASLVLGRGTTRGFLRITLDPKRTPVGRSTAPRAVAAFRLADRELGTGLGDLYPARDVDSAP